MAEARVLLRDSNLDPEAWLENVVQVGYSQRINEVYTATFSLPMDDPKAGLITHRQFVEIYEGDESRGVYRVITTERVRSTSSLLVCYCEHAIATLIDDVLIGEHKINQSGSTPTTETAIEYILDEQSVARWTFGTEDFTRNFWYLWSGSTLLHALFDVPKRFGEDYIWEYDTSTYPWTVSLSELTADVAMRLEYAKALRGVRKREDSRVLFNRLYAYGAGEGANQINIASVNSGVEYVEDSTSQTTYGLVVRQWVDQRYTDPDNLKTAALARLVRHKVPVVYYEVDAADLSQLSGSQVASIQIGDLVHIYDKDAGVDSNVRVVEVTKPDLIGSPGAVYLQLSNKLDEFDLEDEYIVPDMSDTVGTIGNLVKNYSFELLFDGEPRYWTLDGWEGTTEESYHGFRSIVGTGTGTAYCDKITLPATTSPMIVKGRAKSDSAGVGIAQISESSATVESAAIAVGDTKTAVHVLKSAHDAIDIWDMSDGLMPHMVGTIDESGSSEHRSPPYAIYGDYLICGDQDGGYLYIYDIDSRTELAAYALEESTAILDAVAVRDWRIYAVCSDTPPNNGFLEIVDFRNVSSPIQEGLVEIPNSVGRFIDVSVSGGKLLTTFHVPTDVYGLPESVGSATHWTDAANAIDGNTGTYAYTTQTGNAPISYDFDHAFRANKVRIYVGAAPHGSTFQLTVAGPGSVGGNIRDTDNNGLPAIVGGWAVFDENTPNITHDYEDEIDMVTFIPYQAGTSEIRLNEIQVQFTPTIFLIDVSDTTLPAYDDHYHQALRDVEVVGDYAYCTCDDGTDEGKIVVLSVSSGAISRVTAVGDAEHHVLCTMNEYLVSAGDGEIAARYGITFWDLSVPAAPTVEDSVKSTTGALESVAATGVYVAGVDDTNQKLRLLSPGGADWTVTARYYDKDDNLLDSFVIYRGDTDPPVTLSRWVEFSSLLINQDRPPGAGKMDLLLTADTGATKVYVDGIEARFRD